MSAGVLDLHSQNSNYESRLLSEKSLAFSNDMTQSENKIKNILFLGLLWGNQTLLEHQKPN